MCLLIPEGGRMCLVNLKGTPSRINKSHMAPSGINKALNFIINTDSTCPDFMRIFEVPEII